MFGDTRTGITGRVKYKSKGGKWRVGEREELSIHSRRRHTHENHDGGGGCVSSGLPVFDLEGADFSLVFQPFQDSAESPACMVNA